MPDLEQHLDPPEIDTDTPERRRLAVALAAVALLGSIAAAASAITDGLADRERREAQRQAIGALGERSAALSDAYDARSRSALYGTLAARRTLAATKAEVFGSPSLPGEIGAWKRAAGEVAAVNPFPGEAATTSRLFAFSSDKLRSADLLSLQSEATRETAGSWAGKADRYFVAVTLLAVVLALLGLMASIGEGFGRWLLVTAGLLGAVALVVGLSAALTSVTVTPEGAWTAVADGNARLAVGDPRGAVAAYDRALQLREDYVAALRQRAPARVAADSLALGTYVISNSTPEAYAQATRDLERAMDAGVRDLMTLTNRGAFLFHLRQYRDSEELSREALEIQPLPLPTANLGLVLAAQGREREATDTYRLFVERVESKRGRDPLERQELYSSSLTTLEKLARLEPARAPLVLRLQGLLAAAWAAPTAAQSPRSEQAQGTLTVAAGSTGFRAELRHRGVGSGDPAAWAVYYRATGSQDWVLLQELSYAGPWNLGADGSATFTRTITTCLPPGQLRVDVFVAARRLATATASRSAAPVGFQPFTDSRTGLSGCRPATWTVAEESPGRLSYRGPDGAFFDVRSVPLGRRDGDAAPAAALDRVSARLGMRLDGAARPWAVAGTRGLARAEGSDAAWAAVRSGSVFVVTSRQSGQGRDILDGIWSSLVFTR